MLLVGEQEDEVAGGTSEIPIPFMPAKTLSSKNDTFIPDVLQLRPIACDLQNM
jgi:hypothetical protein